MKKIIVTIVVLFAFGAIVNAQEVGIVFPRAFAFAIDDMGWNIGNDDGDVDGVGPYRIGVDRKMDIANYKAIVEVGKTVGVRVQGLFVMGEMDRENILGAFPSTTQQGANWDNSNNVCQEQIDIMDYVRENAAYLEFGLHGVGHEYWVDGEKKRAEWYCTQDDHPWTEQSSKEHVQCFKDIMAQYGLSEAEGHSFPESFVPCAYGYYWNPEGEYSTGSIVAEAGVKYVNTLFDYIRELNPPEGANGGGFDQGVLVINRINYGNPWYELSSLPTVDLAEQESDFIETHWSNWLAQDDFLQSSTIQKFIEYYQMVQAAEDRYVAKNTEQLHAQWLYNKYTKVTESKTGVVGIDNSAMPEEYYANELLGNMVLKVKLSEGQHVSSATLNKKPIACYFEEAGYGYIYLPVLEKRQYELKYEISEGTLPFVVYNSGTYNVYSVSESKKEKSIELRVYGTQDVKIQCLNPSSVVSDNADLKILKTTYDAARNILVVQLRAHDMQGETGLMRLVY